MAQRRPLVPPYCSQKEAEATVWDLVCDWTDSVSLKQIVLQGIKCLTAITVWLWVYMIEYKVKIQV